MLYKGYITIQQRYVSVLPIPLHSAFSGPVSVFILLHWNSNCPFPDDASIAIKGRVLDVLAVSIPFKRVYLICTFILF
jgi:hypothetical protein